MQQTRANIFGNMSFHSKHP